MRFGRNTEIIALVIGFFLMAGVSFAQNTEDVINPIRLEAAVHSEKMVRSSQKGDTLVLNANAFQTMQGADSESLLSKMPGISVTDSGVEAAGKDVRRILLDGQEFFGEDALSALRTIPADLVKQVEVINRLSDNAQLTGVDDGEGYTAINIVTKRKRGDSVLNGRLYGSLGAPRKSYITGGNISPVQVGRFCQIPLFHLGVVLFGDQQIHQQHNNLGDVVSVFEVHSLHGGLILRLRIDLVQKRGVFHPDQVLVPQEYILGFLHQLLDFILVTKGFFQIHIFIPLSVLLKLSYSRKGALSLNRWFNKQGIHHFVRLSFRKIRGIVKEKVEEAGPWQITSLKTQQQLFSISRNSAPMTAPVSAPPSS